MKRVPLVVLALVLGIAACQEVATSPQATADLNTANINPRYREASNPPPPPIDTGGKVTFDASASATSFKWADPFQPWSVRLASAAVDPCPGSPTGIILNVTYMLNQGGTSGYLHFSSNKGDSVWASSNGMVKMHDGAFDGKGQIAMIIDGCQLVINLASVNSELSSFAGCGVFTEDIAPTDAPTRPPAGCFSVRFDEVTLNDVDIGGAWLDEAPECVPADTRPECSPEIIVPSVDVIG